MTIRPLHGWDLTPAEARALQVELARSVDVSRPLAPPTILAAADVSYDKFAPHLFAAVVVVRLPGFEVLETVGVKAPAPFPYISGLLSFREAPAVLEAFARLETTPDAVLCDGQGIAHPRRLGLASHLGLFLEIPTIGCAKSRLCGTYDEPGAERGNRSPLIDRGETIGAVYRSRSRTRPLFVSPGHLCDLEGAVSTVESALGKWRLPQPARLAHETVNTLRRQG